MAVVEIAAIRALALWLGEGRLVAGADPLDGAACVDHVSTLRALRIVRRWDLLASMKMLVAIQAGRAAFNRSAYHLMNALQDQTIAELRIQTAADAVELRLLRLQEARLSAQVDRLEDDMMDLQSEQAELLEEVVELRARERAPRPEPEPEQEPEEPMQ
jgi:hypothetical protein